MANIAVTNNNKNTPATCHSTIIQFFVRNGKLNITCYQRSADCIVGIQHNWVQSWALLTYFAHHANLEVGTMRWVLGDAHIYMEDSHLAIAKELINYSENYNLVLENNIHLGYSPEESSNIEYFYAPTFVIDDFKVTGNKPEPVIKIKPTLL